MPNLTQDEINALSGAELDAAIAEADGWLDVHYQTGIGFLPEGWFGLQPIEGSKDYLPVPAYHTGAELGRILEELLRARAIVQPGKDLTDAEVSDCVVAMGCEMFFAPVHETPLAACRAYLWLKTREETSE